MSNSDVVAIFGAHRLLRRSIVVMVLLFQSDSDSDGRMWAPRCRPGMRHANWKIGTGLSMT